MKVFAYILLMLAVYAAFIFTIASCSLDLAAMDALWNQPPAGWHIRLFGWNGLLIINVLCTFVVAGALFGSLFWLPRRLDKHDDGDSDASSTNDG